jgi:hypothetical protein
VTNRAHWPSQAVFSAAPPTAEHAKPRCPPGAKSGTDPRRSRHLPPPIGSTVSSPARLCPGRRTEARPLPCIGGAGLEARAELVAQIAQAGEVAGGRRSAGLDLDVDDLAAVTFEDKVWESGQRLRYSTRPGSASATVGRVRMSADPVSSNWPRDWLLSRRRLISEGPIMSLG